MSRGFCLLGQGTTPSKSDYGCKCKTDSKYWGVFCDQCNTNTTTYSGSKENKDIGPVKCELYASLIQKDFVKINDPAKVSYCIEEDKVYYNENKNNQMCLEKLCIQNTKCDRTETCMPPYTGKLCDNVCFSNFKKGSLQDRICKDIQSHGGTCNYCVHGTCGKTCQCEEGWVGEHCDKSCDCNGHGKCILYGTNQVVYVQKVMMVKIANLVAKRVTVVNVL